MEQLLLFIQERWLIVLLAIVVLFLVLKVIKSMVKWAIVIGLVAAIIIYGSNYVL